MKRLREKIGVQENMSLVDRSLRIVVGLLVNIPMVIVMVNASPMGLEWLASTVGAYFLLTGMMGWEPIYAVFHGRTCGTSERNRCGTYTYELDAALGHHPHHDRGYETKALKPGERITGVDSQGSWL